MKKKFDFTAEMNAAQVPINNPENNFLEEEKRLLEKNARNGKLLSQGTPDGKVIYVSATELLERLQEKEKESIKK